MINFKYYENVLENAEFTDDAECQSCGSKDHCLEGEYFDHDDEVVSVCLECLHKGLIRVNIPDYIKARIEGEDKEDKIDELERTPPAPWIQYNDWPVCCGDFTKYLGEWNRERFSEESKDGEGPNYLLGMLDETTKEKISNYEVFWDDIGQNTSIFVFECLDCLKKIAVPQSY